MDEIYQTSVTEYENTTYSLLKQANGEKKLVVQGDTHGFTGSEGAGGLVCALSPQNALTLRSRLPWLNPVPLGVQTSFGFGDRIGLATPGHVAALEAVGGHIAPIFAQQSVRENTRTGRTPQQVLDEAVWGLLQQGWRSQWGADADHVKESAHVAPFVQADYTFYTIDPSDHVDNEAQTDDRTTLQRKASTLPWRELGTTYETLVAAYCSEPIGLDGLELIFDDIVLLRALVKYGRALAHTVTLAGEIRQQLGGKPFDLEMSVDETDTPTSVQEHFFIANELLQRDVPVVSLAPRFVGKFQKGVDYMGDLGQFEAELVRHTAVMRHFDRYKLSIHTGSDKFSIYEMIDRYANGRVHVKTAGTSYLEALRVIAMVDPPFFRQILDLAHRRFAHDRKTYFLDCRPQNVPAGKQVADADLPGLLEDFDARQLLHVTFGSILDEFGVRFHEFMTRHETDYQTVLGAHFKRHLKPFAGKVVD